MIVASWVMRPSADIWSLIRGAGGAAPIAPAAAPAELVAPAELTGAMARLFAAAVDEGFAMCLLVLFSGTLERILS